MNRANEARDMTKKLGSIAERTGCAIVLIGHMNKGSGAKAAYRGMGSIDFFAVARSVLLVGRIEGQPNMRAKEALQYEICAEVRVGTMETLDANIEAMEQDLAEILRLSGEQERLWKAYEDWKGR